MTATFLDCFDVYLEGLAPQLPALAPVHLDSEFAPLIRISGILKREVNAAWNRLPS